MDAEGGRALRRVVGLAADERLVRPDGVDHGPVRQRPVGQRRAAERVGRDRRQDRRRNLRETRRKAAELPAVALARQGHRRAPQAGPGQVVGRNDPDHRRREGRGRGRVGAGLHGGAGGPPRRPVEPHGRDELVHDAQRLRLVAGGVAARALEAAQDASHPRVRRGRPDADAELVDVVRRQRPAPHVRVDPQDARPLAADGPAQAVEGGRLGEGRLQRDQLLIRLAPGERPLGAFGGDGAAGDADQLRDHGRLRRERRLAQVQTGGGGPQRLVAAAEVRLDRRVVVEQAERLAVPLQLGHQGVKGVRIGEVEGQAAPRQSPCRHRPAEGVAGLQGDLVQRAEGVVVRQPVVVPLDLRDLFARVHRPLPRRRPPAEGVERRPGDVVRVVVRDRGVVGLDHADDVPVRVVGVELRQRLVEPPPLGLPAEMAVGDQGRQHQEAEGDGHGGEGLEPASIHGASPGRGSGSGAGGAG